jgi:hypothetical protein
VLYGIQKVSRLNAIDDVLNLLQITFLILAVHSCGSQRLLTLPLQKVANVTVVTNTTVPSVLFWINRIPVSQSQHFPLVEKQMSGICRCRFSRTSDTGKMLHIVHSYIHGARKLVMFDYPD